MIPIPRTFDHQSLAVESDRFMLTSHIAVMTSIGSWGRPWNECKPASTSILMEEI